MLFFKNLAIQVLLLYIFTHDSSKPPVDVSPAPYNIKFVSENEPLWFHAIANPPIGEAVFGKAITGDADKL